jgi:hypothetical protein
MYVLMFKSSQSPDEKLPTCLHRLTLAQLRTLRSTTGGTCHRDLAKFPTPRSFADVPAPPHACTIANAPVNFSMYVLHRP